MTPDKVSAEIRGFIEQANGSTKAPWRYAHVIDGINARALIDSSGYHFGQIDDVQNGEFIAASRNLAPKIAQALLVAIDHLDRIDSLARIETVDKEARIAREGLDKIEAAITKAGDS